MSLHERREKEDDGTAKEETPEPSCVSMRSHTSMDHPFQFRDRAVTSDPGASFKRSLYEKRKKEDDVETNKAEPPERSCVSMRSQASMDHPFQFSKEPLTSDPGVEINKVIRSVTPQTDSECQALIRHEVKDQHKATMKNKYKSLYEGIRFEETETLLNSIYTQLYILDGETEGVNKEHEVLQMEKRVRTQDTPIYCNDIFKLLHEPGLEKDQIKTVLTKGIAGIGKTVSVQKFILDWTEGRANQDVDFMFVLPLRELNLIRDHQYSLHRLLLDFHPELKDLDSKIYEESKVVFIFDGLDESRIALFSDIQKISDVNESSSVGVLMSNLIRGDLLPSALIWITSRPAAANQIPSKYISRVTDIQGFNDPQKEEYFRKRISDEDQANKIISHIRRSRSLHIMCHIPVFCWISATVLQNLLKQDDRAEIPQTLTEMYIHFLLTLINMKNQKYEEKDPEKLQRKSNRNMIVKLCKLAFKQLMKGNVMFYEEDLIESGVDISDASVYSGICTEIFKQETVIRQRKVYSFIHLSFQEFLAAFFVFYSHVVKNKKSRTSFLKEGYQHLKPEKFLFELLTSEVDKSLQTENGRLDLFLRFLLGVSLESNQRLLQDLLTHTVNSSETIRTITQYIKDKLKGDKHLSVEKAISLFLCLLEMKDQTLYREIQEFVKSDNHSVKQLSPSHCSTIAYILQASEEVLDEFDLKKFNTSDEGRRRLIPAVVNCRKALLADCSLSGQHFKSLFSSLLSSNSSLRELDLSHNNLQDSRLFSDVLRSSKFHLSTLRLSCCKITGQFCKSLSFFLQSSNSTLRELDLSKNSLQDSGVKLLSDGLKSPHCQLHILRLAYCNLTAHCCESLASCLQSPNSLRELDLSDNDLQDSGVKLLSDGLKSPHCQLEILRLSGCMVTEEGCSFLSSALRSNPSHLRELDLSYNHPGGSLVQLISDPNYRLESLNMDHGGEFRIATRLKKYACDLTLDINTAHTRLSLSEDNRKVTLVEKDHPYPDHPERFDKCFQVLSRESLTGRCYWEAEWSGFAVNISMTYKGINRKHEADDDCRFGYNDKSWSLKWFNNSFAFRHNNRCTFISVPPHRTKRVGVYLNSSAGSLSFYSISETHTLADLHTFSSTFTEPLYAGFEVDWGSSVTLLDLN